MHCTPSASNRRACSRAERSFGMLITPVADVTRYHGTSAAMGSSRNTRPTSREHFGIPASRATSA